MKKLFLILTLFLAVCQVDAQKIHWIVDVQDNKCKDYFKRNFADIVNSALKESGVMSDFQNNATELQCNSEDIIVFLNIGNNDFEHTHNQLAAKNPKLILSVSAQCDDDINISLTDNSGSMYIAPEQLECIKDAFLNTCGVLISSDCKVSEICQTFFKMLDEQEINFEILFKSNSANYKTHLDRCGFQSQILDNPLPINNIIEYDVPAMEHFFDVIVGSKSDVPNQDDIFSSDCIVFVIGQDGRTLIDRLSIGSYLLRVTMSSVLLKAVPIAVKLENGKIKQLYVREYYKKR